MGSGLAGKVSVLIDALFLYPLSFACPSLTVLGDFVWQATYVLMKICYFQFKNKSSCSSAKPTYLWKLLFSIRTSHHVAQQSILRFIFVFPFIVYTLAGQECIFLWFCVFCRSYAGQDYFFGDLAIHSLDLCRQRVYFLVIFAVHSLYSCGPGMYLFIFLRFLSLTLYTLVGQEFFFFFLKSLGSYSGACSSSGL